MEQLSFKIETFEGPLDLLLHLISRNKLDINDIPIIDLVDQYIEQINYYKELDLDIASEFLEMAARLIYLKTLSLLPNDEEEAEELKAELTGELIEYQLCKQVAKNLSEQTDGFKMMIREPIKVEMDKAYKRIHSPNLLIKYYIDAVGRGLRKLPPSKEAFSGIVQKKIISVSGKIVYVLRNLRDGKSKRFYSLFEGQRSKSDVVATFLAVLELIKSKRLVSNENNGEIQIKINKAG